MYKTPELFFDLWPILDNPQAFPFFEQKQVDENILLIRNILFRDEGNYICISDNKIDLTECEQNQNIYLSYYSRDHDWQRMIYPLDNISLINSSVIYKKSGNSKMVNCVVEYATMTDCSFLPKTDETEHDYIRQIYDAVDDKSQEVFVLKYNGQTVSFLVLTDRISKKFNLKCKCISVVYTLPAFRRQGFAKDLIQAMFGQYRSHDFLYVADSDKNTGTNRLAVACGFTIIGYNHQIKIFKV